MSETKHAGGDSLARAASKKLLIIDDHARVRTAIAAIAAALGLDTREVGEPQLATETFIDFRPDAVLLDMVMPEHDGLDIFAEMLLTGFPARFILMSEFSDAYLRLARGVAAFHGAEQPAALRKPLRRDQVAVVLRTTLGINNETPA